MSSVLATATIYLANPVNGEPEKPTGLDTAALDGLWSNALWVVAVLACFALLGCGVMAWSNHRHGQSNEGMGKAGVVLGVVLFAAVIPGVVGAVSGT